MKNLTILFSSVTLGIVLGLSACSNADQNHKKLVLTGSSTVYPLAAELARNYESKHLGVRIEVKSGGSSKGITDARQGVADIGMVSRALHENEKDLLAFTIARDGISILLHRDNPVARLTNEKVIAIYTDKVNNWQQVGGNDAPITVTSKEEGRSTLALFTDYFKLKTTDIRADVTIGDNEEALKTVLDNPNAIAYVSIGTAEHAIVRGMPLKLIPIEGVDATIANIRNKTFPISRPLNFVVKSEPTGLAKDFISFAKSEEANSIVKERGFVPISP
jgi:phosphate transport system substrate-binding protein